MYYVIAPTNQDLQHHGILGMKWGVRRYQNADGSYTRAGLERYRKSESKYNEAKSNYESAKKSGNKANIKSAKQEMRSAKKELSKNYDKLKTDNMADKGKELYKSGKTITETNTRDIRARSTIGLATAVALYASQGKVVVTRNKVIPLSIITASAAVGVSAVESFIEGKHRKENKYLRAYYAH